MPSLSGAEVTVRVRFAPSPTGNLHIGNVRTALFNYLFAKREKGMFVLRVEDTDRERSRPEYLDAQKEDLLWLGLCWDEGPDVGGDFGPYVQSERLSLYQEYVNNLIQQGKAYECYVTEEEVQTMKRIARAEKRPPRFDNRGRDFTKSEIEKRRKLGVKPTVRFKIEKPKLTLKDLVRGNVSFNLDEMVGDFVIQRANGTPTYHMAACVDDGLMKITHVIRGEDHLSNTPKHILLSRALGFTPPNYGHLSLVHGPHGEALSKRLESVSVKSFREAGILPHALANYIALLGWAPGDNREIFTWEELKAAFQLAQVNRSASNYDEQKLNWLNGEHFRALSDSAFSKAGLAYLKERGKLQFDETLVEKTLPVFKDNISRLSELEERLGVLREDFPYENETLVNSKDAKEIFQAALTALPKVTGEGESRYKTFVNEIKPKVKAKGKNLFLPLRVALTGREHGPELKRIFPILGEDRVARRLKRALNE